MTDITKNTLQGKPPVSAWQLFALLMSGKWQPGEFWSKASYRRKFVRRGIKAPVSTWKLLNMLVQWPDTEGLLLRQPRLPVRLHRSYLAFKFTRRQSLNALLFHYTAMRTRLSYKQQVDWLSSEGLHLATINGKDNNDFSVVLMSEMSLDKEGDCTMVIRDKQARILAKITFSLCLYRGKPSLFIGGLQGASRDTPHEVIQSATKACYGLFPKRIVLDAVCYFARYMKAEQILATGNEAHIFRNTCYRDQAAQVHASYDDFWQSQGASCNDEGYYILPLDPPRKAIESVSSKKRAEYRRRFALLDTLVAQMQQVLS